MPHYSVATTKDHLSSLIDKALAGEEVVITRDGKPTVELRVVQHEPESKPSKEEVYALLRRVRESLPATGVSYLDLKRADEMDGLL
jgi:antitoxin (DNA-binding transcriptional repressor) of toxin-antitoxin stability system